MPVKVYILAAIAVVALIWGILWVAKSFSPEAKYDFWEDARRSFFAPHRSYEGFYNDGKPRRIVPWILILGTLGLLAHFVIRFLHLQ